MLGTFLLQLQVQMKTSLEQWKSWKWMPLTKLDHNTLLTLKETQFHCTGRPLVLNYQNIGMVANYRNVYNQNKGKYSNQTTRSLCRFSLLLHSIHPFLLKQNINRQYLNCKIYRYASFKLNTTWNIDLILTDHTVFTIIFWLIIIITWNGLIIALFSTVQYGGDRENPIWRKHSGS